ncbi:MAG: xanthine dehydrogenase family protein subunit M [Deferrisomatales bacterium]
MRIRPFDYHAATALPEALELLGRYGARAQVLAGGTDLVLAMKDKRASPEHLVDIRGISELEFVERDGESVRIGALARHADVAAHPLLRRHFPGLCAAVGSIGSWQIRNVGTVGGNLCNASPAADAAAALLALGARVVLADRGGLEQLPLASFVTGPGATALRPGQLLREVVLDLPSGAPAGCYLKLRRRKGVDISLAGVAVHAELDADGRALGRVGIALGGVAPTPLRASEAEALLTGRSLPEALEQLPRCVEAAVAVIRPITDVRASADYRRAVVASFVGKAVRAVLDELFGKGARR